MKKYFLLIAALLILAGASFAQSPKPQQDKSTFVYVIHMVPKFQNPTSWGPNEQKAVMEHMNNLKKLADEGTLLHAGRTVQMDDKMFGIVVFNAESLEKAKEIANSDPGVKAGMMTIEVFPYWNVITKGASK